MSTLSARRPLLVVAVLAMVATMLFAINAGTASAAAPDSPAVFTACPDNAGIPPAGFSDTAGTLYSDSVDCLKYYTVTMGTTPTTYGPQEDVTRAQMALFLARMAASAGVVLSPTPPDAGFTDIGGLSAEAQWAINALADAGIAKGTTATTYSPAGPVLRNQMALFLTRFLGAAHIGPGGTALAAAGVTGAPFTDIAGQTFESWTAIQQSWNLGLTTGNTATTYNPAGHVTRGQMALFLTRTAAHANTRPAGVNLQGVPTEGFGGFFVDLSVTVRNADFSPSANTDVDLFGTAEADPFEADGTCDAGDVYSFYTAINPCILDVADPTVDIFGNLMVFDEFLPGNTMAMGYAWTGPVAAEFDIDTTAHSKISITAHPGAAWADVSANTPEMALTYGQGGPAVPGPYVRFGTAVNYTVQLMDGLVPDMPVPQAGVDFDVRICHSDAVFWAGFGIPVCTDQVVTTNASGTATFSVNRADPSAGSGDALTTLVRVYGGPVGAVDEYTAVNWRDSAGAESVVVSTTPGYKVIDADGVTGNQVMATVYDWFGHTAPAGVDVHFESDRDDFGLGYVGSPGDGDGQTNQTNGAGVAYSVYNWNSLLTGEEELTVWTDDSLVPDVSYFYWVNPAVDADETTIAGTEILVLDAPSFVGVTTSGPNTGDYVLWTWEAGDQFFCSGTGVFQSDFEADIAVGEDIDVFPYFNGSVAVSGFDQLTGC